MAEASKLLGRPRVQDINKYCELAEVWYYFGIQLEVNQTELDNILVKYNSDRMRMIKMFTIWLDSTKEDPTYRKLIKALMDIDKRDIAESLCKDLGELT